MMIKMMTKMLEKENVIWFRSANKYVEHKQDDIGFFKEYDFIVSVCK